MSEDLFPRLEKVLGDRAYGKEGLPEWAEEETHYKIEITGKEPGEKGFKVIKWRWVAERAFAWLGRCRRHSRDYEMLTESSEAMIKISVIHMLLKRLAPPENQQKFHYRETSGNPAK